MEENFDIMLQNRLELIRVPGLSVDQIAYWKRNQSGNKELRSFG
jgi:hypothetical protein